jgi:hypothetical protein
MGALLALVPLRDWFYGAIAAAAVIFALDLHHKLEVANQIRAESAAALATAQKTIATNTADYKAAVSTVEAQYAKDMSAASQQHNADLARLRARAAGKAGPVLPGAPGTPAAGPQGDSSFGGLGELALNLADALRADDAALIACYADRNALTGK